MCPRTKVERTDKMLVERIVKYFCTVKNDYNHNASPITISNTDKLKLINDILKLIIITHLISHRVERTSVHMNEDLIPVELYLSVAAGR